MRRNACGVTRRVIRIDLASRVHDGGGVVALHAVAPPVAQQRPVGAADQRLIDRLVCAWVERPLGGLVALADDPQRRQVPGAAEITNIRLHTTGTRRPFGSSRQISAYG